MPSVAELRAALQELDLALVRHRSHLKEAKDGDDGESMLSALRQMVELMESEAQRLRALLSFETLAGALPGSK